MQHASEGNLYRNTTQNSAKEAYDQILFDENSEHEIRTIENLQQIYG